MWLERLGRTIAWWPKQRLDPARVQSAQRTTVWKRHRNPARFEGGKDLELPAVVDVLYFEGCPNHEPAVALVNRLAADWTPKPLVRIIGICDAQEAERRGFLGSPTIRVNGRDIEPSANERSDFGMSCRMFSTSTGLATVPDAHWICDALDGVDGARMSDDAVGRALAVARIPTARCGDRRLQNLSAEEANAYRTVVRMLASGTRPNSSHIAEVAVTHGVASNALVHHLQDEDLVHFNLVGDVETAYPFSGVPTRHHVSIDGRSGVHAMCAVDALGTASMLGASIDITSADPTNGEEIRVAISNEVVAWGPEGSTVLMASKASDSPSRGNCCSYINFFATSQNALDYLAACPELDGYPVSIPFATVVGECIFGRVLDSR